MKHFFHRVAVMYFICLCSMLHAQTHPLDRFLTNSSIPTIIATQTNDILQPQDLDFCNISSRKNELWVVNYGDNSAGGNMVVIYDAGKPAQRTEYRYDSHSSHFMLNPTAFAMADSMWFSTIGEALNSVGNQTSNFMGPVLWDNDTNIFARIHQSNWAPGKPLGSHSDMLHESPRSMGIAFDTANIYWVFDGYHGCLYRYDYQVPHEYGADDHSDGIVWEYPEVQLKRIAGLPSHMVLDRKSGWLYIVDNGNKRILRVNTRSGDVTNDLPPMHESLQLYQEVRGVEWETIDSGYTNLSGIDYFNGRLVVGNNGTGEIRIYNTTTPKPKYLGSITTGDPGMLGIKIGPDSNIWYVNKNDNTVIQLAPDNKPDPVVLASPVKAATAVAVPTELSWHEVANAASYLVQVSLSATFSSLVVDSTGITKRDVVIAGLDNSTTYYWRVKAKNSDGESAWSEVWNFKTVGAMPEKPILAGPPDAMISVPVDTTLTWNTLTKATAYNIQISTVEGFFPTSVDEIVTTPKYEVTKLSNDTKYYWHVRGINDGAVGEWSDTWTFTTEGFVSVKENPIFDSKIAIDDVFPNPSSTHSSVKFTLSEPMSLRISIIDGLGEEAVLLTDRLFQIGKQSLTFQNGLASGRYFYRFVSRYGELVRPFIIQK